MDAVVGAMVQSKAKRFDLHVHSQYSRCALGSNVSLKNIVKQAKRRHLAGFALTDHNSTKAFSGLRLLQKKERDLLVVFGEEVKVLQGQELMGELLLYFVQGEIKPATLPEILDEARCQDVVVSVAHPFDKLKNDFKIVKDIRKANAVEVFNARACSDEANKLALKFAAENKMPFTAGSDSHSLIELGKAGIICDALDEEELRKAILKSNCTVFGKRHGYLERGYFKMHQVLMKKGLLR